MQSRQRKALYDNKIWNDEIFLTKIETCCIVEETFAKEYSPNWNSINSYNFITATASAIYCEYLVISKSYQIHISYVHKLKVVIF